MGGPEAKRKRVRLQESHGPVTEPKIGFGYYDNFARRHLCNLKRCFAGGGE